MATTYVNNAEGDTVSFITYKHKYQMRASVYAAATDRRLYAQLGQIIWCPKAPPHLKKWRCWDSRGAELGTAGGEGSMAAARAVFVSRARAVMVAEAGERQNRVAGLVTDCREAFEAEGEVGLLRVLVNASIAVKGNFQTGCVDARFKGLSLADQMMLVVRDVVDLRTQAVAP